MMESMSETTNTVEINSATITVEPLDGYNWEWSVTLPVWESYSGEDLRQPQVGEVTEQDILGALLSFLSAAAESYAYSGKDGENANLFPLAVTEWAIRDPQGNIFRIYNWKDGSTHHARNWHIGGTNPSNLEGFGRFLMSVL